jgi:elongation factor G
MADLDGELANYVIETESLEKVPGIELDKAIKRIAMSTTGVPVLLGSSYKNIGVQPLMDAVIK